MRNPTAGARIDTGGYPPRPEQSTAQRPYAASPAAACRVPELRCALSLVSAHRIERHSGSAECEIDSHLSFDRQRLQRNGFVRPSHQEIGADADTKRDVAADADKAAGERA